MKLLARHIVLIVLLLFSVEMFAQTEAELKKRKANTEKEIEKINKQLSENARIKKDKITQISLLNKRIEERKKIIRDSDIQISITEKEVSKKNAEIKEIKEKLSNLKEHYSELIANVYKRRKKATWLMYVFASEDVGQAFRRLKYMQSYSDVVFLQADKIEKASNLLSSEIVKLDKKKQELTSYKEEKKRDMANLSADESAARNALSGLKKEEAELKKQIQQKRAVLSKLNSQIEKMLKKEIKSSSSSKSSSYAKAPANVKLSADFASNRGKLPWPVKKGTISGFFGRHFHAVFKNVELPPNNGIDISTNADEPVLSVFSGVVRNVFSVPGMNVCLMIQHGEYFSVYCRLSKTLVKVGETVKTGTQIGKVLSADKGATLHFELWKGTTKLNPQLWLLKK